MSDSVDINVQNIKKADRNSGIDLLKIVAMMFICVLHVCNFGGITSQISEKTYPYNYNLVLFLKALTYCAVDIYAMISGYLGYNKKFKLSRPVMIWLELVFYTLTCTLLIALFSPQLMPENAWFKSALPVMNGEYWYMTAYFGMVILMPLLNVIIQKSSMKTLSFVLLGVFVFYCTVPVIMDVSVFNLGSGYSTVWLCIMYICGGYFARLEKKPHPLIASAVFIAASVVTWIIEKNGYGGIRKYTSPTIVLAAAALVISFSQIKINVKWIKNAIGFVAQSTLGIYIIHVHLFFWENFLKNCAQKYAKENVFFLLLMIFLLASAIFLVCLAVDALRRGLFWLIHIKPLLQKLDKRLEMIFDKKKEK